MSIDSASTTAAERLHRLEAMLEAAIASAKQWDYDLPLPLALTQAHRLLPLLAEAALNFEDIEVDVAIDGSIEVSVSANDRLSVINIARSGEYLTAATSSRSAREVLWSTEDGQPETIIREIMSAA